MLDLKVSYAKSFVDAPYWYRYNSLPSYRGARTLRPEHLSSLQVTPTVTAFDGRVHNRLNLFYNHLYDFVFRNNKAAPDEPIYQNAGVLRTIGIEDEVAYAHERFTLRGNLMFQRLLEGKDYGTLGTQIFNVPNFTATLIGDVYPVPSLGKKVGLNLTARYVGARLSPIEIVFRNAAGEVIKEYNEPSNTLPPYVLVNAGVRLTDLGVDGLSIDATVYNLLDQRYDEGGSVVHPYPQPGRWFLLTAGYQLPL